MFDFLKKHSASTELQTSQKNAIKVRKMQE